MFNIHEKHMDTSTIKSKTNQQILEQTQHLRNQKNAVLKIESFYIMCNNKYFLLRMHQIKSLHTNICNQFWVNPNKSHLTSLTANLHIPIRYEEHAFKCGYLLPLLFPKSTLLFNLLSSIPSTDVRHHLMMQQIIQFIWLIHPTELFHFLECCTVLHQSDVMIKNINCNVLDVYYDLKAIFKLIIVKSIPSSLKAIKLQGLFYLCLMLPIHKQNQFALLFQPLLKSLSNITHIILLFDTSTISTIAHHVFYKCKPDQLWMNINQLFNTAMDDPLALAKAFLVMQPSNLSRQYLYNIYYMLNQYVTNTFDAYLTPHIHALLKFHALYSHLIASQCITLLDDNKEDYEHLLLPLLNNTTILIRCALLRINKYCHFTVYPLFWNPLLRQELQTIHITPSSDLRISNAVISHYESKELRMLCLNQFHYNFFDRLQLFHATFEKINSNHYYRHKRPYTIDRDKDILMYLFTIDFTADITIQFINGVSHQVEDGIDGGGLYMEFMSLLILAIYEVYFVATAATGSKDDDALIINLNAKVYTLDKATITPLNAMTYVGVFFARCIRDDIVLPGTINMLIYTQLIECNTINDLYYYDVELYTRFIGLLQTDGVGDMGLCFTIMRQGVEVPLIKSHQQTVTDENKLEFVMLASKSIINSFQKYTMKLRQGIQQLIPVLWFDPNELQQMMHGNPRIDYSDIIGNSVLQGFEANSKTIIAFHKVLQEWDQGMLSKFLQFVTGRQRPPVLGCKSLSPLIGIIKIDGDRMPSSATCMNLLRLPDCEGYSELKRKMEYALMETKGFGLH